MPKRLLAAVAIPLGVAACERMAAAPEVAPPAAAAVLSAPRMHLSPGRRMALQAAVADARLRVLPAVIGEASPLEEAFHRLDDGLAADDAAALMTAVAGVEASLAALPTEDAEAQAAELDAIRLLLGELRFSATGEAVIEEAGPGASAPIP